MSLASISIQRPVLAIVMSIVIVLFGVLGYTFLGVREFPAIDPPVINVRTSYTGANAKVVESQITEPLEKSINGIQGIRTISSTSSQGSSNITVEFNLDANLEAAANDVRDKVSQALFQLPADLDAPPTVTKSDANSDAILALGISSNTRNAQELNDYAENVVGERLQTIPDVSTLQIWGQKKYAMRLRLDPVRMAAYGITPQDVQKAEIAENRELPGGKIEGNKTELVVNTRGRLSTAADFNKMIVKEDSGRIIRFKDIGYAELGAENEETILRESGEQIIGVALVPQPGANYLNIAKEFYRRVAILKKDLPKDLKVRVIFDSTIFIAKALGEVKETLLISLILVILTIYFFFRDWIIAFRPLIDIPVSLIGAFFIMYVAGFSINILTMLAIVLATGLVVDDGIVVTENIYKKVEDGMDPREAAFKGSSEIFFAVLSTSITLAAVFLPVIFLQGFVGRLFREFGVVVAGSVLISAFVSLSLTPMLNAYMNRKNQKKSKFYILTEPFFIGLNRNYENALIYFLKNKWISFPVFLVVLGLIILLGNILPSELSPLDDRSTLRIIMTAPEGASYDLMDAQMKKMQKYVEDSVPERKISIMITSPGFTGTGNANTGFGRIVLKNPEERKLSQQKIAEKLNKDLSHFSDVRSFVIQQQTISVGFSRGLPVQFVLQAVNFEKLRQELPGFMAEVQKSKVFSVSDVDLKFNKPELDIKIDRIKAKDLGVSVNDIAQSLQLAFGGTRYDYFLKDGRQYQVIGQVDRVNRDRPADLKSLYVKGANGQLIQLDNVVSIHEVSEPPALYKFNRFEAATVSAAPAPGYTVGDGIQEMKRIAAKILDPSFTTSLSGSSRDYAESNSNIIFAFLLALTLIYLVLAAQFESFRDPFIIMITVPLALAGALFSLWYTNQTLNIFSEIGIIVLIGLVTKNGILIVEFANQLKEKGMPMFESILEASVSRLRPILMTSVVAILGALPIAFSIGSGSASRVGLGVVIIGGLSFSLLLTLFIIPAMYMLISKKHNPLAINYKEKAIDDEFEKPVSNPDLV